jgi:uncharacterized alpha-E superfamily protein
MLLSRLAERTFWLGRYVERAESLARALLAFEQIRLDIPGGEAPGWRELGPLAGIGRDAADALDPGALADLMILDRENPSSLRSAVHRARENLRRARSLLPFECWHTLNPLYLRLEAAGAALPPSEVGPLLGQVMAACHELGGQVEGGMMRDEGHAFLRLGVHLERADMVPRIVTAVADALIPLEHPFAYEDVRWMGLLRSVGAYGTYRRSHHARANFGSVLRLLLREASFPRSFAHALLQVGRELATLPRNGAAAAALRACWPAHVPNTRADLAVFADAVLPRLADLGAAIVASYFPPGDDDRDPGRAHCA